MGTTLTALQSGQASIQWVAAIEGFDYLITDGDAAAAVAAWAASGEFASAVSGMTVHGDWSQRLDPWDAFPEAGTLQLSIQPDSNDRTSVMFKNAPTITDTYLTADIDADATTITVEGAAGLTSPVYIGTERITFTGSTATTLTGCARGRKAPFGTSAAPFRFGHSHRSVSDDTTNTQTRPVVGDDPRVWVGKWVGLWAHRRTGSTLDVQAQAQLVFAGKIVNISDDPATGCTIIDIEHVAEIVAKSTIGRDAWRANVAEGIYVRAGDRFRFQDFSGVTTTTADDLVATTGAAGTNELEPGVWSVTQLASAINAWLSAEKAAARIMSDIEVAAPVSTTEGYRSSITWTNNTGAAGTATRILLDMRSDILRTFGFTANHDLDGLRGVESIHIADSEKIVISAGPPIRYTAYHGSNWHDNARTIAFEDEQGAAQNQYGFLPPDQAAWADQAPAELWGVFRAGPTVFVASYDTTSLTNIEQIDELTGDDHGVLGSDIHYGDSAERLVVQQIFVISGKLRELLPAILASTGTAAYNHATHDVLPGPMGCGIPWDMLGDDFVRSCRRLDGSDMPMMMVCDKPMTLADLIGDDLVVRRAGLVFKNGALQFARWSTPNAATAEHAFTEANKAAPSGTSDINASATVISSADQRCSVKLRFNRHGVGTDTYRDAITLRDVVAIDDGGGEERAIVLSLRNTYAKLGDDVTQNVDDLAASFLATLPLFSRPARLITRSIGLPFFEGVAPGDICTITDSFARDPDTGLRGLVSRQGVIVAHRYDFGGASAGDPNSTRDMGGEVTIMLVDDDNTAPYCPTAQVDHTVTGGGYSAGYNSGTLTLDLLDHEHSEATDNKDKLSFEAGDTVRILEIDPAAPGSATSWDRTIASVSSTGIVLTVALSAPAWDAAKRYRVIPQAYASAGRFQSYVYQADSADSLIVDTARANHYATSPHGGDTDNVDTQLPERHAGDDIGDGKPYTTGSERGIIRGLNNLRRSKCRVQAAGMFTAAISSSATGSNWDTLAVQAIRVRKPAGLFGFSRATRTIDLAPMWRSSTGASTSVRITVSRTPPSPWDRTSPDTNATYTQPYQTETWTTSSTTYATGTAASFPTGYANDDGVLWVTVEGQVNSQVLGISQGGESVGGDAVDELDWCKNGDAPQAEFVAMAIRRLRRHYRYDGKTVFYWPGEFAWPAGAAGSRTRWRFQCHTGTRTARFACFWAIAHSTIVTTDSYCSILATNVTAGTTETLTVNVGAVENPKGTQLSLGECWMGTSYIDALPDTQYTFRFRDTGGARVVAATIWEVASTTPEAYPFVSAATPIVNAHRTMLLEGVTNALANNGSHIFNWSVDLGASPRSTTSATSRNLIDNSSTAVSAATPGFIPQLSNCKTLMQSGVPVVFAAFGEKPAAGDGFVELKDDTGAVVLSITVTSAAAEGWFSVTGFLPASDTEKYDVHFRRATGGTLTVNAVSLYQLT
jgi:hypothetical protein